jgi:hypothetical protein
MILYLDEDVFASPRASTLGLLAVFHACFEGRHALITDPPFVAGASPVIDGWLQTLPEPLRLEVGLVLDEGPRARSQRTATAQVAAAMRIGDVAASDFRNTPPTVSLSDAVRIVQTPLRLLLENSRNDGAFLRKIAHPDYRSKLLQALEERWVELENGGGIGELTHRVKGAAKDPRDHMRLWVMVDSDAREPGVPSEQSARVVRACQRVARPGPIPVWRLERRSIENYIPVRALFAWAELEAGEEKTRLRRCADAFSKLTEPQRAHYNMKEGLLRDLPKARRAWYEQHGADVIDAAELSPLFARLPEETRRRLHDGFGEDVCALFHDHEPRARIEEDWLPKEIPYQDRAALLQSIFDRL